mgnify:CR=1 FL=1
MWSGGRIVVYMNVVLEGLVMKIENTKKEGKS